MKWLPMRVQVAVNALRGRPVMYRVAVYSDRAPGCARDLLMAECQFGLMPAPTGGYAEDFWPPYTWDTP